VDPVNGLALRKPQGWTFGTLEWEAAARARVLLGSEGSFREPSTPTSRLLAILLKYPEPSPRFNPSIKISLRSLRPLEGRSPEDLAAALAAGMRQSVPGLELHGPIESVTVSNRPAAHFRARFLAKAVTSDQTFAVLSRIWVVPRGNEVFTLVMTSPPQGPDVSEREFASVLETVVIEDTIQ
jgi:hypothetical protein